MERGFTVWLTGMSGAGKSTITEKLARTIRERVGKIEVLDGDIVRTHLSKGLGFSKEDRDTNIRRIGFVCHLLTRNGVPVISAAISPYRAVRDEVRSLIGEGFVEVHVDCPLEVLVQRDVKGLYAQALRGEIKNFTGVDDPYEPPLNPELHIRTDQESPDVSVGRIVSYLENRGFLPPCQSPLPLGEG